MSDSISLFLIPLPGLLWLLFRGRLRLFTCNPFFMRTVTDPTTGKDIGVEDLDETSMEPVTNPMVCGIVSRLPGERHSVDNSPWVSQYLHSEPSTANELDSTVTDPTTGKDIGVEDLDETSMEPVTNPMVCGIISNKS
jgi:hypothetical protein